MRRFLSLTVRIGLPVLVLLVGGLVVWVWRGRLLEGLTERILTSDLGVPVEVGEVEVSWSRGITLRDLVVRASSQPGAGSLVSVGELRCRVGLVSRQVDEVEVRGLEIVATERLDGSWDLLEVLAERPPLEPLPVVRVRDARLHLQGDGPAHRRIASVLDPSWEPVAQLHLLELTPIDDGVLDVDGWLTPEGLVPVVVRGTVEPATRTVSLQLRVTEESALDLGPGGAPLAAEPRRWLTENQWRGSVAGRLRLDLAPDLAPEAVLQVRLLDVRLVPRVFPYPLEGVGAVAELRDGRLVVDDIVALHQGTRIRGDARVEDIFGEARIFTSFQGRDVLVDDDLLQAARARGKGALVDAFEPEGMADVTVRTEGLRGEKAQLWIELRLRDAGIRYQGLALDPSQPRVPFPLRVHDLRGTVHLDPGRIRFDSVVGVSESGARVVASCDLSRLPDGLEGLLEISATSLPVDETTIEACTPALGERFRDRCREYGLAGEVDVRAEIALRPGGQRPVFDVELLPRELRLRPERFPYPLVLDSGRIRSDGATLVLEHLRGRPAREESSPPPDGQVGSPASNGSFSVQLEGTFEIATARRDVEDDADDAPSYHYQVRASDVPVDDRLRQACAGIGSQTLTELLDQVTTTGQGEIDVDFGSDRNASGAVGQELRLRVRGLHARSTALPALRLRDLSGEVIYAREGDGPWRLRVSDRWPLEADVVGGRGRLTGWMRGNGVGGAAFRFTGLECNDELLRTVRSVSQEVAEIIESFEPEGVVQAHCELGYEGERWVPTLLRVSPDLSPGPGGERPGVALRTWPLPRPFLWRTGTVEIDFPGRQLTFSEVRGGIGEAVVVGRGGQFTWDENGVRGELKGGADLIAVPVDLWLATLAGSEGLEDVRRYEPTGLTHVEATEVSFFLPFGADAPNELTVTGRTSFDHCSLKAGTRIRDLTGSLSGQVRYKASVPGLGGLHARGSLGDCAVRIGDLQFTGIRSTVVIDRGTLRLQPLTFLFAGGQLDTESSFVEVDLDEQRAFEARLTVRDVDLRRLLGEHNPRTQNWGGQLFVDVSFAGQGLALLESRTVRPLDLVAWGGARIRNGELWEIPLFDKLYSTGVSALLGLDQKPTFARGKIDFAFSEGSLALDDLELESEVLTLFGDGSLGPERFEVFLTPEMEVGLPVVGGIVERVLSYFEKAALSFRFGGTYATPTAYWAPRVLTRSGLGVELDRPRLSTLPDWNPDRF